MSYAENKKTVIEEKSHESKLLGEKYNEYLHASGMKIFVFPKKLTTAFCILSVNIGGDAHSYRINDTEYKITQGTAHFLEHRMFSTSYAADVTSIFSDMGADVNAFTSSTKTAYITSATERYNDALYELIRFVTDPCFTDKAVENEKKIIAEEIKMYADDSYGACASATVKAMYGDVGFTGDICGTIASISQITAEELSRVYEAFYTTENMMLTVCGDISGEDVISVVDRVIPPDKYSKKLAKIIDDELPLKPVKSNVALKRNVSRPIFEIGIMDPCPRNDIYEGLRREAAMMVLTELIFSRSEPFYNILHDAGIIAPSVSYGYTCHRNRAYAFFHGTADDPEDIFKRFNEAVEQMKEKGFPKESFIRNLRVRYAEEIKEFDSTADIAYALLDAAHDGYNLFDLETLCEEVTYEGVYKILCECFNKENYVLSAVYPKSQSNE